MIIITIVALAMVLVYGAIFFYCCRLKKSLAKYREVHDSLVRKCYNLEESIPCLKAKIEREGQESLNQQKVSLKEQFHQDHVHTIAQAASGEAAVGLQHQMKSIIEKTYSRMSQEFLGSVGDNTDEFLAHLKENLVDKVWDSLQQVKDKGESPMVFPEGTRMAYTKGRRTVFVIEQKPQVRSVSFDPKLICQEERKHAQRTPTGNCRFGLAFPYVYFFEVFDNETFSYHEVYFRNKALTSPREHLYIAPLPNVHRSEKTHKAICMGTDFYPQEEGSMARQAEMAVAEFWQLAFNEHLGHGGKIDKRITDYADWQARTQEDPLFILNMKWGRGNTAKKVLNRILKARKMKHDTDILDKEARGLLEKGVKNVIKTIKSEIDSAKKNHTLRSGNLDDVVKEKLLKVVTDHSARVFANCSEI